VTWCESLGWPDGSLSVAKQLHWCASYTIGKLFISVNTSTVFCLALSRLEGAGTGRKTEPKALAEGGTPQVSAPNFTTEIQFRNPASTPAPTACSGAWGGQGQLTSPPNAEFGYQMKSDISNIQLRATAVSAFLRLLLLSELPVVVI
jgi:hypothetical protein